MSTPLDTHYASTEYLEATFVGPAEGLAGMVARLLDGRVSHLAILGRPGSGKSHAAELVVRQLGAQGWRVARVLAPARSLGSLADLLAYIVAVEQGGEPPDTDATEPPSVDTCAAALEVRYRDTSMPLALLIDDLPALMDGCLHGRGELRRFARMLEGPGISIIATSAASELRHGARPLASLFHVLELPPLTEDQALRLLERHARFATGDKDDAGARAARALVSMVGMNPRVLVHLYQLASRGESNPRVLLLELVQRMGPHFRRELDSLSAQQGMLVARLAMAPGPMAAARLGRRCGLPTSHTTAILDVLLHRRLVARVPGPGKRRLYALPERLLRIFIVMCERDPEGRYLDMLLAFYQYTSDHEARRLRFEGLAARYGRALRSETGLAALDLLTVLRNLLELLGIDEHDPGNRVLDAFLEQPPSDRELDELLARTDPTSAPSGAPSRMTVPERAVTHVALAAHFLRRGSCAEAADQLARALALAPNWPDLSATLAIVRLMGGIGPGSDTAALLGESRARVLVDLCATCLDVHASHGHGDGLEALVEVLDVPDPEDDALFRAIAAAIPRRKALVERALTLFDRVHRSGAAGVAFLGAAASYAFDMGRWAEALRYLEARHELAPLPSTLDPVHAWLAAMSGEPSSYVSAVSRLPKAERARHRPGMVLALRFLADPDDAFEDIEPIYRDVSLDPDEAYQLFGALLWVRHQVAPKWLARACLLLARLTQLEPEPYRRFREFIDQGSAIRSLTNLHPEMREAVDMLRGAPRHEAPHDDDSDSDSDGDES